MDESIWRVVVGKAVNRIGTRLPSLKEEMKHFSTHSTKKI